MSDSFNSFIVWLLEPLSGLVHQTLSTKTGHSSGTFPPKHTSLRLEVQQYDREDKMLLPT